MADNNKIKEFYYPELSYKLIGIAYRIDNEIGYGQPEKVYCNAFQVLLEQEKIAFTREFYYPVTINDKVVAKNFFDFLIDNKVIVEIKIGIENYRSVCSQVFKYLKSSNHKLAIIIRFTKNGVKIKRIPNFDQPSVI